MQEIYDRGWLKEDNATNRAAWGKKLISYTGDPRRRPGQAREEEEELIDRPTKVNSEWPVIFVRL